MQKKGLNLQAEISAFEKIIEEGENAFNKGNTASYEKSLIESIGKFIQFYNSGNSELALALEPFWYASLVKKIDNEQHVAKCFSKHSKLMWKFGRKISPGLIKSGNTNNICFISKVSALLGHTEVMLNVMNNWKSKYPRINLTFIGLTPCQKELFIRLEKLGINIVTPSQELSPIMSARWLRTACEKADIGTAIWLSLPVWVAFIFGYGVAKKQVLWSLKFHAVHLGDTVLHIGMTKEKEGVVYINNNPWNAFQPPLILDKKTLSSHERKQARGGNDQFFIFASLAREEKFSSPGFAQAVVEILQRCPRGRFLFTGRTQNQILSNLLIESNLSNKVSFIGWVDTNFYSNIIDCFLETFPFGCGITGMQALINGSKLNSLWDDNTLPCYYFDSPSHASSFHANWIINTSVNEYVNSAVDLYNKWENGDKRTDISENIIKSLDNNKSTRLFELIAKG